MHGLDTADPCDERSQSRIMEFGHYFRIGDRRATLQRCRVLQDIGFGRQLRWRIHCRILLPRFRVTRPPTKSFDGFPDRLRMRAVVCLEPLGDRGHFRGEESGSQSGIVGRDGEVLALQPLIEKVHVVRFVHDRLLLHRLHSPSPFVGRYQQRPFSTYFLFYCSVEKLMHQRPNPIHFFFQREMARVEKIELCTGKIVVDIYTLLRRVNCTFVGVRQSPSPHG